MSLIEGYDAIMRMIRARNIGGEIAGSVSPDMFAFKITPERASLTYFDDEIACEFEPAANEDVVYLFYLYLVATYYPVLASSYETQGQTIRGLHGEARKLETRIETLEMVGRRTLSALNYLKKSGISLNYAEEGRVVGDEIDDARERLENVLPEEVSDDGL